MENQIHECPHCQGKRFVVAGSTRTQCVCAKRAKLIADYPFLGRVDLSKVSTAWAKAQHEDFLKRCTKSCVVVECKQVREPALFVFMMLALAQAPSTYKVMNVYELIEVYLGKHDEYGSLFAIRAETVCLMMGWSEMENCRQEDMILQFLDICKTRGTRVLFFVRAEMTRYPRVQTYLTEKDFDVFSLKEASTTKKGLYTT